MSNGLVKHRVIGKFSYVTAWFLWHLKDDGEAAKAFTGEHPELLENKLYIDQQIDFQKEE